LEQNAQNVDTIKRSNNNIIEFLESSGYIRFKADYEASSKALYEAYKLWCEDNAQHCLSANRLSSELTQNAARYNVEPTNNIYLTRGRRVRGFIGIEVLAKALY
jgi:putative DNA primase/helicase